MIDCGVGGDLEVIEGLVEIDCGVVGGVDGILL